MEALVTVAAGRVVVISGDTTATGVLQDTVEDTSGVVTEETTGTVVTAFTIPAVLACATADLDICVTDDCIVDSAAVALATLTTALGVAGVDSVVVEDVVVLLVVVESTVLVLTTGGILAMVVVGKLALATVTDIAVACGTEAFAVDVAGGFTLEGKTVVTDAAPEVPIVPVTIVLVGCFVVSVVTTVVCLLGMVVFTGWPDVDTAVAEVFCPCPEIP